VSPVCEPCVSPVWCVCGCVICAYAVSGISACEPVLYCDRFERHVISEVIGGVDPFNVSVMSSPPPDDDDASALLVSPKRDIELGAKA